MAGAAVAVLAVWLGAVLYVNPMRMDTADDAEGASMPMRAIERRRDLFCFSNPRASMRRSRKLERPADDTPAGFFVGFAGYA